jgi:hypothetical protein
VLSYECRCCCFGLYRLRGFGQPSPRDCIGGLDVLTYGDPASYHSLARYEYVSKDFLCVRKGRICRPDRRSLDCSSHGLSSRSCHLGTRDVAIGHWTAAMASCSVGIKCSQRSRVAGVTMRQFYDHVSARDGRRTFRCRRWVCIALRGQSGRAEVAIAAGQDTVKALVL